jgi:SAM-dependent methyltransferase
MTQNIYDTPAFFSAYSQLPRSVHGLDGAPEWSALQGLLPALRALDVLDLGCGFGWFCRWAHEQGAASVLGVDVSVNMLERARAATPDGAIVYREADLETFEPAQQAFDLAYSSLAFHYLDDLAGLLGRVHGALRPGSRLVCSVEHPMMTAPVKQGWSMGADGREAWPVTGYLDEGPRVTDWLAKGVVKRHRTIGTYVALFHAAGFRLSHLVEWAPDLRQVAANPDWARERERPSFLLMACDRP